MKLSTLFFAFLVLAIICSTAFAGGKKDKKDDKKKKDKLIEDAVNHFDHSQGM